MNNKIFQFKLVLLGESAVGKSSLVLRFVKGQFLEYQESTIGGSVRALCLLFCELISSAAFLTQTVCLNDTTVRAHCTHAPSSSNAHPPTRPHAAKQRSTCRSSLKSGTLQDRSAITGAAHTPHACPCALHVNVHVNVHVHVLIVQLGSDVLPRRTSCHCGV
jgi:hypothetical protein